MAALSMCIPMPLQDVLVVQASYGHISVHTDTGHVDKDT